MWQNIWPNSETLLVYLHMSPFSINGWMAAWNERKEGTSLDHQLCPNHYLTYLLGICFDLGRVCTKKNIYRGPGKKLDRDSNAGNCKYYVFEKSITLLTNNGTFRNSCLQSWTSKQSGFLFCGTCFTKYSLYRPAKS